MSICKAHMRLITSTITKYNTLNSMVVERGSLDHYLYSFFFTAHLNGVITLMTASEASEMTFLCLGRGAKCNTIKPQPPL